ncbi:hypothetical protein V8G54_002497 [Vigna mungo]|uniref:Uncharacterized protein n=1 Tax=Vigna mungo TaxID=3915 RepID=A0AAQ3P9D8_VIGMU
MQCTNLFTLNIIIAPGKRASKEILIFNIDKILSTSNGVNISILNATINDVILPTNKPSFGSIFRSVWEPKSSPTINRSKQLNIPGLMIFRKRYWGWGNNDIFKLSQWSKYILPTLLFPSLLKIEQNIPSYGSFKPGVNVMPWFPGTTFCDCSTSKVRLMKIIMVCCVQGSEK